VLQDEFSSGKVSRLTRGDGECCEGVALDATLVPPQGVAAGGAGVRHLVETVNTARNTGTRPGPHKAKNPSYDPSKSTGLRGGSGGDVVLAVRADHRHCTVAKTRALHILHLSHNLDRRWLGLHGLRGRRPSSLLWQGWIHLTRT